MHRPTSYIITFTHTWHYFNTTQKKPISLITFEKSLNTITFTPFRGNSVKPVKEQNIEAVYKLSGDVILLFCFFKNFNGLEMLSGFYHFLRDYVPVCSHRSCCSFLAFVLKGNHSVGAHVPGPRFDLIKCKLKKILLQHTNEDGLKHSTRSQQQLRKITQEEPSYPLRASIC